MWKMTIDILPRFLNQLPMDVQLHAINIGNINNLSDADLADIGLQRIERGTSSNEV